MAKVSLVLCLFFAGCGFSSSLRQRNELSDLDLDVEQLNTSSAPLTFYTELAKLKVYGYQAMFCGSKGTVSEDGKCATIDNYPSPNSHVEMRHAKVAEQLSKVPERQRKGEIIKGNDLGFFILNQYLWGNDGEYKTIGLGISVEDHEFIRPIFDKVVGKNGYWNYESIAAKAKAFLDSKNFIDTSSGIMPFTTPLMHEVHLGWDDMQPDEVARFTKFQADCVLKIILPDALALGMGALRKERQFWLDTYMDKIEADTRNAFPKGLTGRQPSGQLYKLAAGFMDSILFAGGLSVEGLIKSGLNALYSQHLPIKSEFRPIGEDDVEPFVYEVTRLFPGVVGFPWWEPGYDGNKGGSTYTHRTVMNLALSLRDPRVFGDDFLTFRVRDLPLYKRTMGNAWAQPANEILSDGSLGKMSRGCPGQSFSIAVAKAFLTEYVNQQDQWAVTSGTPDGITWKDCTPFVGAFAQLSRIPKKGVLTKDSSSGYYMFESGKSILRRYDSEGDRVLDAAEKRSTELDLSKVSGADLRSVYYVEKIPSKPTCFVIKDKVPWGPFKGRSWEDDKELCAETAEDMEEWYQVLKDAPF